MGCWCETCGITQLPINAGDKCRVFFITKQDYGNENNGGGFCYANDIWYPRGLPIQGEYDDYGGLENIVEDANSQILIEGLKKDWHPYKAKHDWEKDVNASDLNVYVVMEETERDRALIHDGRSPTDRKRMDEWFEKMRAGKMEELDKSEYPEDRPVRPFGLMFVREEVYQAMIHYNPIDAHHTGNGYLYRDRADIFADDMKEWYESGLKAAKERGPTSPLRGYMLDMVSHWNTFSHAFKDPPFCKGMSYYYEYLHKKMENHVPYEDPEVQQVTQGLIEFTKFQWAMSEARRSWCPQSGKGSQNNATGIHKILAGVSLAICHTKDLEDLEYDDGVDWRAKHNEEELKKRAAKAQEGNNGQENE